jgi:hypothetical protein
MNVYNFYNFFLSQCLPLADIVGRLHVRKLDVVRRRSEQHFLKMILDFYFVVDFLIRAYLMAPYVEQCLVKEKKYISDIQLVRKMK